MFHRRVSAATTAATAHGDEATKSNGISSSNRPRMMAVADGSAAVPIAGSTSTLPKRRRRIRRASSPMSGDGLTCIIVLVVLVAALIVGGVVILIRLLRSTGAAEEWMSRKSHGSGGGGRNAASSSRSRSGHEPHHGEEEPVQFPELPASPIYTIPHSMAHIGDRSDEYARLRKTFDAQLPYDPERSLQAQEALRKFPHLETFAEDLVYDIHNCPDIPPPNYPHEWATLDVLGHWSPEDTNIPPKIHQGLCVFDYRKDYVKALTYRNAELPFIVKGDPEVAAAVERWNTPTYMDQLLGSEVMHRAEYSETNHFMYWRPGDASRVNPKPPRRPGGRARRGPPDPIKPGGWSAPTHNMRMTYTKFMEQANVTEDIPHDDIHFYFRLIGCGETGTRGDCDEGSSEWLFDELTFFQPRPNLLYLTEPSQQRGIHCRFGMQGVTIANHFDSSRNAIALLGGERRYILSHPKHCSNLALFPKFHPSERHSEVDWSDPDLEDFPQFAKAQSNEVLLQAGDALYLPSYWFHYIVSLGLNYQCNTRSGTEEKYLPSIQECGF